MDWITFIVSETKAIAWPAVVLTAVVILKQQISGLITELGGRLTTAKGAGIELSFGARIDEVEKSLPSAELTQLTAPPDVKRIEGIVGLPPAYIISQAWLRVEEEIGRLVAIPVATPATRLSIPPMKLLRIAVEQGLITKDELHLLDQLRNLRNQAAHSLNPDISLTDALRYNDIASSLVQQMRERASPK